MDKILEVLRTKKCYICHHLLSVPPIMITGPNKDMYKCGRCEVIKSENTIRISLFEDMVTYISFPCSYLSCGSMIPWGKVEEHERNCRYRTIKCPFYFENCFDVIAMRNLRHHFKSKHRKDIRTTGMSWTVQNRLNYIFVLNVDGELFFLYNIIKGRICVLALKQTKYTKFHVKLLLSSKENFEVIFKDLPVVFYNERLHCFKCMLNSCREPYHPFSNTNGHNMDVNSFTSKLNNELFNELENYEGFLRYSVTLSTDETLIENPEQSVEQANDKQQEGARMVDMAKVTYDPDTIESLRRCLSCPICMMYMSSPIYTCSTGHTICDECRLQLNECPTCKVPLRETRNFALEEMASSAKVPCQNDTKGCIRVDTAAKMRIHELECLVNNLSCSTSGK